MIRVAHILIAALVIIAVYNIAHGESAMDRCQQTHSADSCGYALRP